MPHNGNGNGNGQALVASERPSQPADTGWLARLQALDREAVSRRIASCERPKELKTLLDEIKVAQNTCKKFLAKGYDLRFDLFQLEVQAKRQLQRLFDRMPTAPGSGRGNKRIIQRGKLFELHELGIEFQQAYKHRDILTLQPAEIDSYTATCRAEHRVPTLHGLLNAARKRQMLERNVRNRPWTEDRGALLGSSVSEGEPSLAASAHETIRQFCEEDRLALIAALLTEMPERRCDFIASLIARRQLDNFVQGFYERRGRPDEQRRYIAQLMAEDEPDSNAPNSSERDEATPAVAIAADTTDAATVN